AGADVLTVAEGAMGDLVSGEYYRRFLLELHREMAERLDVPLVVHICGDSTKVLKLYADTGADLVEIDNMVDLSTAHQKIGDRVTLVGNVHTVNDLFRGTPESVRVASQRCIQAAGGGHGFILGSGCLVPRNTPIENVREMVRVARQSHFEIS
ncbi:MAG: uroporphyrinogen decarboxylase family protein, partial [Pirellulaceae bacterium]|nr:uroporphyrinogen decarboxylase family protein [Pirellulaceae bacterium]